MSKNITPFPKRFLWGAATAAHQVEGNNKNQWSEWEEHNAPTLAAQASYRVSHVPVWDEIKQDATKKDNYISGELADHYHRYEEDFAALTAMNMNAYRFSIEWSRIEPEQGSWNAAEIEHYRQYLAALKKRNIEPVVTLFHFTLPQWFAALGGFEKRKNVQHFTRFVEKIISELGKDFKYIITINEPTVYAVQSYKIAQWPPQDTGAFAVARVLNNLAYAHKQAAKVIHAAGRKYKVSVAHSSSFYYAGDDAWLSELSTKWLQYWTDDYWLKKVVKHCDFLGVNYYFANRVYGYRVHNPEDRISDLHWDLQPAMIEQTITRLSHKYSLPILITENGLADANDEDRQWWIASTLAGLQRALSNDVEVIGYLHWSLMDNFEWRYGKWPRFGLLKVDYESGKRTLRPSAKWFAGILKKIQQEQEKK